MSLRVLSFFVFGILLSLAGSPGAFAQISTAIQCAPSYSWASNSLQQNPCVIAAYLQGKCNSGEFSIDPLPVDSYYVGPSLISANPCQCSSVVYSLVSACGDCQNRTYIGWKEWSTNCSHSYPRLFPEDIPPATLVPAWAYLDVEASDKYSPALAQAAAGAPESSATLSSTSSASTTTGVPNVVRGLRL